MPTLTNNRRLEKKPINFVIFSKMTHIIGLHIGVLPVIVLGYALCYVNQSKYNQGDRMMDGKRKFGFSLTECVIAIFLTALVLAAAYPLLTSTTRKLHQARDHYAATTICLAQIERARDIPYDQLGSALGKDNAVRINESGSNDPDGRFRRTTAVQVNTPDEGVTLVVVTVDIMDRKSGSFMVENEAMSYLFTSYLKPLENL